MDAGGEVLAEKHRAGHHSGETLAEMGEIRQVHHGIRRKIQQVEAESAHDVVEEVGKRGAEPAEQKVDEERVPFRVASLAFRGEGTCGGVR